MVTKLKYSLTHLLIGLAAFLLLLAAGELAPQKQWVLASSQVIPQP